MMKASKTWRSAFVPIHRWAGVTVGLAASYFAITGIALAFKPELQTIVERNLAQQQSCAVPVPLDAQIASSRHLHPAGAVRQLELTRGGRGVTTVRFTDMEGVYVDACTGSALGMQGRWDGVFGTIEKLHRLKFIGNDEVSETVTGSVSFLLGTLLVCLGVLLWWPRSWSHFKMGLKIPRGLAGQSFDVRMHRTIGSYAAIVLIASSVAAWPMAFDWADKAVYVLTNSPRPSPQPALPSDARETAPAETLLASVLAAVPAADSVKIVYPRAPRNSVEVAVVEHGRHAYAQTMIYLNPETGSAIRVEPYAAASRGQKVRRSLSAFHTGNLGGLAGKMILVLGIAALPFLAFTGLRSWIRKQNLRRHWSG